MEIIWSPRFDDLPEEELPPVYAGLVQREVPTRWLEVWQVGDDGRYERMRDRDGQRLSIPVDADVTDLGRLGLKAGQYMLIARDRNGRIRGRRGFELRPPRSSIPAAPRAPTAEEQLQRELAETRKRMRDMQSELEVARRQIETADITIQRVELQRDRAQRKLAEAEQPTPPSGRVLVSGPADGGGEERGDDRARAVKTDDPARHPKRGARRKCRRRLRLRSKARPEPAPQPGDMERWLPVFEKAVDVLQRFNSGVSSSPETGEAGESS